MKTKSGRVLTTKDIETLAAEAEAGYDPARLKGRIVARHESVSKPETLPKKARFGLAGKESVASGTKRRKRRS
jgi:hypothetical protein